MGGVFNGPTPACPGPAGSPETAEMPLISPKLDISSMYRGILIPGPIILSLEKDEGREDSRGTG
jgi:hypothetical protein